MLLRISIIFFYFGKEDLIRNLRNVVVLVTAQHTELRSFARKAIINTAKVGPTHVDSAVLLMNKLKNSERALLARRREIRNWAYKNLRVCLLV